MKPSEALLQEWFHDQIASCALLVAAKQSDPTMDNPDSARMVECLHRQRDNLVERQKNKTAALLQQGDRPSLADQGSAAAP